MSTSTAAGNSMGGAGEDAKRRGRKRGKHNFEPGYKDLLFDEWMAFSRKHERCPKMDEVAKLSEEAFLARRAALKIEDPTHPHLSILEAPLDAVQVKNLVNNEKRRRSKLVAHFSQGTHVDGKEVPEPSGPPERDEAESPRVPKQPRTKASRKKQPAAGADRRPSGFQPVQKRVRREAAAPASSATASGSTASAGGNACETASVAHHPALGVTPEVATSSGAVDLEAIQASLKGVLNAHLSAMSPSQHLALWQLHQQHQQQASMQQALAALGMGGPAFGGAGSISPALLGLFGASQPQPSFSLERAFGMPPSPAPANPSLSQVMDMMQMFHQLPGNSNPLGKR